MKIKYKIHYDTKSDSFFFEKFRPSDHQRLRMLAPALITKNEKFNEHSRTESL